MTPEKLPTSRKYFSTELSPHGNSGAVFFCPQTLLKIWPIDTHLIFKLSKISKGSYMPRTIQNEKPTEIFLAQRFLKLLKEFQQLV